MRFHDDRHLTSRLLVALGVVAASVLSGVMIESSNAAPFAATASVTPQIQYLGDSTGTTFTFTVENTGTADTIGAVQISRPGKSWTITACPLAPAGWSAQRSDTMCRYRSAPGTGDDLAPGTESSAFQVTATVVAGTQNITGTWSVKVSKSSNFDKPSKLVAAATEPPGLGITAYSFQVLDAVVDPATTTPGAACPTASKSAITGSTGHTIVICGRNRTTGTLTPVEAQSSLAGTFVASHGSFSSGAIAPSGTSRVLGSWDDVTITSTAGPNKTVLAKIGSASNRTSPVTTLTGYEALNNPPDAVDDTTTTDQDNPVSFDPRTNDSDPDGDPISISAIDLTETSGNVSITGGGTGLTYDPNGQFDHLGAGEDADDTFTYTISDPFGATDTATVTVTVTGLDDSPSAVDDTATVTEDAAATAITVLANDTDVDGDPLSIISTTQPANGAVAITGGGTGLTYAPNTNYCNSPPGTSPDTFTYTLNGGSTATVSVAVTCVNDAPVAVDDSTTVAEDASATAIDVLANDTDVDGGPMTIDSVTQPANGTVAITGGGTGLTYAPAVNYCNSPPGTTLDTFTYTLNGGSTATVSVTVTCADDLPVAVDDSTTVAEDASATAVNVLANDTDADGGPMTIDSVTQPANGTVAITGGGTGLTYQPNANYCNAPPGTSPDTFTYTLNGGSTATVSVTVTCVQDPPVAVDDSKTVAEDSAAAAVDVLANDTDVDGGPMTIDSVTQPANGTVAITGGGTGLTYQPAANYCNAPPGTSPDTFTYTLNGGSTATVSVTVTCADDLPVAVDDSSTVTLNASAAPVPVLANDTDVDGGPMTIDSVTQPANGTVVITGGGAGLTYQPDAGYCNAPPGTSPDTFTYTLNGGSSATVSMTVTCDVPPAAVDDSSTVAEDSGASAVDVLANDTDVDGGPMTIDSVTQPTNGTVVITGGGTGLTYAPNANYCNSPPGTSPDTFTYTLNGGSTATVSMTVECVDDGPAAVDDSSTVAEDSGANAIDVLANDTDADGGPMTIDSVTQPTNGTVVITGGGTGLTYAPNANYCGATADTFTYTVNGGDTATVSVTVTCAADAPVVDTSAGTTSYTENDPATVIDAAVTVTDPDAGSMITLATVAITTNYAGAQDVLALAGVHPGISAEQTGATLTLTGTATPAAYQAALRAVTYVNTSEGPSTLARVVTFTVTDDTGSGSDTKVLTVTGVNDPPTAVNDTGTTDEDTPLNVVAPGVLANDTDVDPGDTKTVDRLNGSATLTGSSTAGGSVTINANGSYTYTPPAAFQSLSTGESDTDSFTYRMTDSGGASSTATVNLTVNGVSDAPTAVADSFDAIGNTGLFVGTTKPAGQAGKEITGSVLTNDTDPDTAHASLVAEPVINAPTTLGGTITIGGDGNFIYHPDDGDTAVTDTFTYRVCDSSPCNSGTVANATGTLSLPIAGQVWYVKNNQAAGGDGTSDTPFDTLVEAESASGAGDTTFVYDGDNTSAGLATGYLMEANERLIGEVSGLSLDPDGGGSLPLSPLYPATAGATPTLTTVSAEDVVSLAAGTVVDGFILDPFTGGGGIGGGVAAGGAAASNVTIANIHVNDTGTLGTQPGLELNGTTGTNDVRNLEVDNGGSATAIGVKLLSAGTVNFASTGTISITTSGAKALDAVSTNFGSPSVFDDITVTGSGTGGVNLDSTTGSVALGDGIGSDLLLTTTTGADPALRTFNATNVTVDAAGTDELHATGGPAFFIIGAGGVYAFEDVDSSSSSTSGMVYESVGAGTLDIDDGTVSGYTHWGFAHSSGTGNVDMGADIADGVGVNVSVINRTGGSVTFTGAVSDSGDASGGAWASNNSNTTVRFEGGVSLDTGTSDAFFVSNTGTIVVTDPNGPGVAPDNTVTSTTGRAVVITGSTIGSDGVTFRSISSNGATSGITLSATGASGALTVSGNGGACTSAATCTGGAIQGSTGAGISLTNVLGGVNLTRMQVSGGGDDGIRATTVAGGLGLAESRITSNGNAVFERGLDYTNVTGSSTITNTLVTGSAETNARIANDVAGTNTLSVTGSTFSSNSTTLGAHGMEIRGDNTATINANVNGNTFSANRDNAFLLANGAGSPTMNLHFNSNAVTGGNASMLSGQPGVVIAPTASAQTKVELNNNTVSGTLGRAIIVNPLPGSTASAQFDATVTNNTIGNGTAFSGSAQGEGMMIRPAGNGDARIAVRNNLVRNYAQIGIRVLAQDGLGGTGNADVTVTGNTVSNPSGSGFEGIYVSVGSISTDNMVLCADIGGAGALGNTFDASGTGGVDDLGFSRRFSTDLRLPGYTTGGNLTTYIQSRNIGVPTVANYDDPLTGQVGGCALPTLPA